MAASVVAVLFRAGSAGGRSVKDTDRQHPTETNSGFLHFQKIHQDTRKPKKPPTLLVCSNSLQSYGLNPDTKQDQALRVLPKKSSSIERIFLKDSCT